MIAFLFCMLGTLSHFQNSSVCNIFRFHTKTSHCTSARESNVRKRSIDKCITLLVE